MWGDTEGMNALCKFFREMATAPREVEFTELGFCAAAGDRVIVSPYKGRYGALRKTPGDQPIFRWDLDKSDAEWFGELVDVLAASGRGHQYLETFRGITVTVSIGEYPDDLLESKFRPD
ncbi:MAG: hypothetical protein JO228_09245 [Xanthobacteraceae bacterium]|nr:hypothetical protein [Xanthobacteraceae bacterium]